MSKFLVTYSLHNATPHNRKDFEQVLEKVCGPLQKYDCIETFSIIETSSFWTSESILEVLKMFIDRLNLKYTLLVVKIEGKIVTYPIVRLPTQVSTRQSRNSVLNEIEDAGLRQLESNKDQEMHSKFCKAILKSRSNNPKS